MRVPIIPVDFAQRIARAMGIDPERIQWKLTRFLGEIHMLGVYVEGPTTYYERRLVHEMMEDEEAPLGFCVRGVCHFGFHLNRRSFQRPNEDLLVEGDYRGAWDRRVGPLNRAENFA